MASALRQFIGSISQRPCVSLLRLAPKRAFNGRFEPSFTIRRTINPTRLARRNRFAVDEVTHEFLRGPTS